MRRDAGRRVATCLQEAGDRAVCVRRDRRRDTGERGFEHEVVGEREVAQHLRRFELLPGVGEGERARRENVLGELDREVDASDRRHPRQRERLR